MQVSLTGMAPAMTLACYTCAIKKPLRSKVNGLFNLLTRD